MAATKTIISRPARLPNILHARARSRLISTTATLRSSSQFVRSDFQGQPFSGSYETGQPTRGPLGEAHSAPRLTPKRLKEHLDKFVVGQERAKKMLSVAVYNQYQRIQEMQRQDDEERERFAKIARRTMAYEKFTRHPTEDEFPGQVPTVNMEEPPPYPKDARVGSAPLDDTTPVMIEKSNIMVVGPTGVGKTMMIKILARVLEVPFSMSDCTPFTQAGYIGEDAEVCVQRLLAAADYDVARAEHGIICLDEVDKLAMAKMVNGKDVSGEGVQQALLKIIEGTTLQITAKPEKSSQRPSGNSSNNFSSFNPPAQSPAGAGSHSKPETYSVRTDNILFIFSGAFVGLQKMILDRVSKGSIGFGAPLRSSSNEPNQNSLPASDAPLFRRNRSFPSSRLEGDESFNPLDLVEPQDFQKFGLIPEFIGRIPITTALNALSLPDLVRILTEPRNSLVQQYTALFASSGIELHLTTGALHEIAKEGHKMGTGARGLRSAAEALLWPIMYEVPGSSVRYVLVTEKAARYEAEPEYFSRGQGHRFRAAVKTEEEEWQAKQDAKAGKGVGEVSSFEEFREQAKSGM